MARHAIGLLVAALGVWQAGCDGGRGEHRAVRRDSGVVERDAGFDAGPEAAPDAAAIRGETPRWPEAEQEVELPYHGSPASVLLVVSAQPGAMDLHLNVDTTSSMRDAIDELQSALRLNVINRLRARVADVAFGVSGYADFPFSPFGNPGMVGESEPDRPFVLHSPITTNVDRVIAAVNKLDQPLGFGGDPSEASAEALYQVATGAGYVVGTQRLIERGPTRAAVGGGTLGGVGFREYALRVVLHVADSPAHTPKEYADQGVLQGTHSLSDASKALAKLGARVVSIHPTGCEDATCMTEFSYRAARIELERLALETSASFGTTHGACPTGIAQILLPAVEDRCPLVYDVRYDGTGLSRTIADGVIALLEEVRFGEVHADTSTDRLGFVRDVRTEPVEQPSGVQTPMAADRLPAGAPDAVFESYLNVDRRSQLGFRVTLQNLHIAPRDVAQRYRVAIRIIGDSVLLEERFLRIVVPARAPGAPDPAFVDDLDGGP